jgi:ribosome biogenesis GTPase
LTVNNQGENVAEIKQLEAKLVDKLSIFVGQTGAGKTSTLNNFLDYEEKTQAISKALNRGKHTTTNVSLYRLKNNILLADSPGFSSFEIKINNYQDLAWSFKSFKKYLNECKFNDCLHLQEKGCAIKTATKNGEIPEFFYNDYVKMMKELKEK